MFLFAKINEFNLTFYFRPGRPNDGNLTVNNLMDAIITHQIISKKSTEPPGRDSHRPLCVSIK